MALFLHIISWKIQHFVNDQENLKLYSHIFLVSDDSISCKFKFTFLFSVVDAFLKGNVVQRN